MKGGQIEPGTPDVKKCIVVTPTSLVGNWAQEFEKWVPNRLEHVALSDSTRDKVWCCDVIARHADCVEIGGCSGCQIESVCPRSSEPTTGDVGVGGG